MESKTESGSKRVGLLALQRYLEVPTDDLMDLKTMSGSKRVVTMVQMMMMDCY